MLGRIKKEQALFKRNDEEADCVYLGRAQYHELAMEAAGQFELNPDLYGTHRPEICGMKLFRVDDLNHLSLSVAIIS